MDMGLRGVGHSPIMRQQQSWVKELLGTHLSVSILNKGITDSLSGRCIKLSKSPPVSW